MLCPLCLPKVASEGFTSQMDKVPYSVKGIWPVPQTFHYFFKGHHVPLPLLHKLAAPISVPPLTVLLRWDTISSSVFSPPLLLCLHFKCASYSTFWLTKNDLFCLVQITVTFWHWVLNWGSYFSVFTVLLILLEIVSVTSYSFPSDTHDLSFLCCFYLWTPYVMLNKKFDNGNIYCLSFLLFTANVVYYLWQLISLHGLATVNCTLLNVYEGNYLLGFFKA